MTPRRQFYRRRRWLAAGLLWLVLPVAYPALYGPAVYGVVRGWVPPSVMAVFLPAWNANRRFVPWPYVRYLERYGYWWEGLAHRHEGRTPTDSPFSH